MKSKKFSKKSEKSTELTLEEIVIREECEADHLFFSRYFFKHRENIKFIVNWHHHYICDAVQDIIDGKIENLVINVPPGASKTELVVINLIARGLAINPRARFLHLSYADDLALLNSQTARDLIDSDEYQRLWPRKISEDTKSKKRWNVKVDDKKAGGVYATSLGGQITGFRAGHMAPGFNGCILIDDPLKPDDAFSKAKLTQANRKLLTTVKSRKANPKTPIILIMQRISENDPVEFIQKGSIPGEWIIKAIPAILNRETISKLEPKYQAMIHLEEGQDEVSYWPYKERLEELQAMREGRGSSADGSRISKYVYAAQYDQNPVVIGGNIIKGSSFVRYRELPKMKYRKIFGDTAQKTAERNDFSVFGEFGLGVDNKLYLLDLMKGKWEAPELKNRAIAFWAKAKGRNVDQFGQLREMIIEDKSSGTGLIQSLKIAPHRIPIKGIERVKDKLTRVMDVVPEIDVGNVCVPEDAPFVLDFIAEGEAFTADDSHAHDDQVDVLCDAITDMISPLNKIKIWGDLAKK